MNTRCSRRRTYAPDPEPPIHPLKSGRSSLSSRLSPQIARSPLRDVPSSDCACRQCAESGGGGQLRHHRGNLCLPARCRSWLSHRCHIASNPFLEQSFRTELPSIKVDTHWRFRGVDCAFCRHSPYEHLALRLATVPEAYTGAVVHDTLGHRVSPSLLRAR